MIKILILIVAIFAVTSPFSFQQFFILQAKCQSKLNSCSFNPFSNDNPIQDDELLCAQDAAKSGVCYTHYSQCLPSSINNINDQLPVVCWLCYTQSPSNSQLYQNYRDCLQQNHQSYIFISLLLLLAFVFIA